MNYNTHVCDGSTRVKRHDSTDGLLPTVVINRRREGAGDSVGDVPVSREGVQRLKVSRVSKSGAQGVGEAHSVT